MTNTTLDTAVSLETPEAIDILLPVANITARAGALMIDWLVRCVWMFISSFIIIMLVSVSEGFALLLFILNAFVTFWLYPIIFEVYCHGQTLGKKAMDIKVVMDNGTPITWSSSLVRNLLRLIDGLPMFYALGAGSVLLSGKSQRIGDMLAGTLVVYNNSSSKKLNRILQHLPAMPLPHPLTLIEQQAIVSFAERHHQLSVNRQEELAETLMQSLRIRSENPIKTALCFAKTITGQSFEQGGIL